MSALRLILLSFFVCLASCSSTDSERFSDKRSCFLLWNLSTDSLEWQVGSQKRCSEQIVASSTFKIPLALMAFDSGILKDENQVLKWNGHTNMLESWKKDHNAATWMKDSVVWFSQRLTPQLGREKISRYLEKFSYGNQDFRGNILSAWLLPPSDPRPALRISAEEQVQFLRKLWKNQLPVSDKALRLTKKIMYLDKSPQGYELFGKTGSNYYDSYRLQRLGWFVGYLKKGAQEYVFAFNFSDLGPNEDRSFGGHLAKQMTLELLKEKNLWQ